MEYSSGNLYLIFTLGGFSEEKGNSVHVITAKIV